MVNADGYAAIGPIAWLAFNHQREPTSDNRVRQAIAYAINRSFIIDAVMLGTSQEARTGIHPGSPFYEPDVEPYDLDIDKADQILDEAGYPRGDDGFRFPLTVDYGWANIKKGGIWSNTQGYANPEVDAILDQAGRELDPTRRKALYSEFRKLVADELPVYWACTIAYHTVSNKKVGNPMYGIWGGSEPADEVYLEQ